MGSSTMDRMKGYCLRIFNEMSFSEVSTNLELGCQIYHAGFGSRQVGFFSR